MATVFVNQEPVAIPDSEVKGLNCIQAAGRAGVFVPHYCWHPSLSVVASCRMCLVEVGDMKDGKPVMLPRVVPGCQTPVKDGTVIVTNSEKTKRAQADTLEGILLNHPLDCPVCDKAGECLLQDFSYRYGRAQSRMADPKNTPPNKPHISSKITLFTDRCIMCSRCVRFTREIAGTAELTVVNRGDHAEIDIFPGEPLENKLAGNVVDLCPVGALGSKDFLYKQRVWYLRETPSVCAGCATGCSIFVDANKDIVFRLRPRENPQAQGWFMCDEGRWGYHYANAAERLRRPQSRGAAELSPAPWSDVIPELRSRLGEIARKNSAGLAFVLSPFLTCEEAFLLAKYARSLSTNVQLAIGPIPVVGKDDTYPRDRRGNPVQPVRFTIRAEKCPNRRGVEAVLRHFQGTVVPFEQVVQDADHGQLEAVWVAAGYPRGGGHPLLGSWITDTQAESLAKAPLLVVQDLFATPLSERAQYVLPAAAWSEKDGTFVNHAGLAQTLKRATHAPGESRAEGQVYADLLGRRGLFRSEALRPELAAAIPEFAQLAAKMPGYGVRMELPTI